MIRLAIWLLAGVSLSSGLLLITFLLRNRGAVSAGETWLQSGVLQLSGVVLTLFALAVSMVALQIALTTYQKDRPTPKTERTNPNQPFDRLAQENPAPPPSTEQSTPTVSQPEVPSSSRSEENSKEETSRTPAVEFWIADSSLDELTVPIPVTVGSRGAHLPLIVRNNGSAPALKGTLVVIADPNTLSVDESDHRSKNRWNPHRFQKALPDVPAATAKPGDLKLDLDIYGPIPERFSLNFIVFGENFEAVRKKLMFQAVP